MAIVLEMSANFDVGKGVAAYCVDVSSEPVRLLTGTCSRRRNQLCGQTDTPVKVCTYLTQ